MHIVLGWGITKCFFFTSFSQGLGIPLHNISRFEGNNINLINIQVSGGGTLFTSITHVVKSQQGGSITFIQK